MASPVIVPLDGTARALAALPLAKALADLEHGSLKIVHVAERLVPPAELLGPLGIEPSLLRGSVLDEESGDPIEAIARVAQHSRAAFIVLCTHTHESHDSAIGATTLGILKRTSCPVVLVRPERGILPWSIRRVLLPHDGTPATSGAIGPAAALARKANAELFVLHVAADREPPVQPGSVTSPRYVDQPQHEWPSFAGEFLERLGSLCPLNSLRVKMAMAHGPVAAEVVRSCGERSVDLVVLAWKGEWEGEHAFIIKSILDGMKCPALIVRAAA